MTLPTVLDVFVELVQIDSPSGSEAAVAEYIATFLAPLGFELQHDDVGNLLARWSGAGVPVLLCAHMDTVQPGIGVVPQVVDSVVHSSGDTVLGADNKAAIASILVAVAELHSTQQLSALELLFTVKEETGGGVEFFPFEWLQSKHGYIFDYAAPLGEIITAAPYITNFTVKFTGKAAHAKQPELGVSAVVPLAKFILQAGACAESVGEVLVNCGKVSGGTGANVIPETAAVFGEVRSFDAASFRSALVFLEKAAQAVATEHGVAVTWQQDGYCAGYQVADASVALKTAQHVLLQMGFAGTLARSAGVSDANVLQEHGVDVVVFSDGVSQPHSTHESVAVADLEALQKIVVAVMVSGK